MEPLSREEAVWTPTPYTERPYDHHQGGEPAKLGEIFAELGRHRWTLAACALAGIAIGLAMTAVTTPVYRARTTLQLEGFRELAAFPGANAGNALPGASVDNYLQNEVKLLESDTLARRVSASLGDQLQDGRDSGNGIGAKIRRLFGAAERPIISRDQRRMQAVKEALNVHTSLQSQVLDVTFDAPSPSLAAAGANLAAQEFIALNREARESLITESTNWLNQQAKELKQRLEGANQGLQNYASSAGLIFAGSDDTLAQARMRQIQEALVRAEADRAEKQARYEAALQSGRMVGNTSGVDPIQQYQTELQTMRKELSQLRTIYTPNHAKVIGLEAQIQETEQALARARDEVVTRLRNEYLAAASYERTLQDSQSRELRASEKQMSQQRHYEVLKSEAQTTQHLYEQVLENLKQAGAASSLRSTNVRVIDPALPPQDPYKPNMPLNASIGFAVGSLAGVALVLVRGRSSKVTRPGESAVLNVPELGAIPSSAHTWSGYAEKRLIPFKKKSEPGLVTWTHDASPMSEAFRAALNSILFGSFLNAEQDLPSTGRVLTVTSFDPMAGKTTVLSNLAVASAERKQRVVIIDADLRRPRVHSMFNMSNDWGLSNVLEQAQVADFIKTAPIESLVRATHVNNVWVLPAGPGSATIPSLLYSAGLRLLLLRLRTEFDMVFIDTPPLMLYSDARLLGRLSDGLLMVVRANTRTREELKMVYSRLLEDRIHLLGTILNQWEADPQENREYGSHYYRYQQATNRPS